MMGKTTVTQWFDGSTKPHRKGVYEQGTRQSFNTADIHGGLFSYWNGEHWCGIDSTPLHAMANRHYKGMYQTEPWRGLATPTTEGAA